jgi:glutamate-1-semialdehyde 2,1-aminomutase
MNRPDSPDLPLDAPARSVGSQWHEHAERFDAWAATRSAIMENDSANAEYPQYVARAEGAFLWDVDDRRFLDFIMGYGPVVLGHRHPEVNAAVHAEIERGTCTSPLWSRRQGELAELLVDVIPGAQKAFLMKTGSDATSAAVRLARIATGRDKVAKWGYHGWHDWTAPRPAGVPRAVRTQTLYFTYNDLASLQSLFDAHLNEIACVIMMPFEHDIADPGFLAGVRDIAHQNGAVFIFDEMRSGFRVALGGAQEYFGVTADLSTFSKAMANGYAVSAVVGQAALFEGLRKTHMSSTFFANPPAMAAAIATIGVLRRDGVSSRLWRHGERFVAGLREAVAKTGLPATVRGYAIAPFLDFGNGSDPTVVAAKERFYAEAIRHGLFLHPNHQWFTSAAHTDDDIDAAVEICREAASVTTS